MAKLPDINMRRVSLPAGPGPGLAVDKFQTRQSVAKGLLQLGQAVGEEKAKYDIADASSNVAAEMARFEQAYAGKEMFSPDEVRELGLDSTVQLGSGSYDGKGRPIERENIPAHEVYPLALQKASEEALARHGNAISSGGMRKAWMDEMKQRHNQAVTQATRVAAQNRYNYEVKLLGQEASALQESGLYDAAALKIMAMPIADRMKDTLLVDNSRKKEVDSYSKRMLTSDTTELDALEQELVDKSETGDTLLSDNDLKATYLSVIARKKSVVTEQERLRGQAADQLTIELEAMLQNRGSEAIVGAQLADPDVQKALGKTNYQYLVRQLDTKVSGKTHTTDAFDSAWFNLQVAGIEAGDFGTVMYGKNKGAAIDTYDDAISHMRGWIRHNAYKTDPVSGETAPRFAGSDINAWNNTLDQLADAPFQTNDYKAAVADFRARVYGTDSGLMGNLLGSEVGSTFANGMRDLRESVAKDPANGVRTWQQEKMPLYLEEKARMSLMRIRENSGLRDVIKFLPGDKFGVDTAATESNLMTQLNKAVMSKDERRQRDAEDMVIEWESWLNTYGKQYAN